jgi:hypothetical protein
VHTTSDTDRRCTGFNNRLLNGGSRRGGGTSCVRGADVEDGGQVQRIGWFDTPSLTSIFRDREYVIFGCGG